MALTDKSIRALTPTQTPQKVFDGRGLYLLITPAGAKSWRVKYRVAGREKTLTLGLYPEVSLKQARDQTDDARRSLARGIDPSIAKQVTKAVGEGGDTFDRLAREWYAARKDTWVDSYSSRVLALFENDLLPYLGRRDIQTITAPETLEVLRRIERRAPERSRRALQHVAQVFNYAIASGRTSSNPAAALSGAMKKCEVVHFPAPTDPRDFAVILQAMYGYQGSLKLEIMLKLGPRLFARPGELRKMQWQDLDLEAGEWRYTLSKTRKPHVVPLSHQAVALLRMLQPSTGSDLFVFPQAGSSARPMSDAAFNLGLRRCEIGPDDLTGHGLRATARTILDEVLNFRPEWIEMQLGHTVKDPNGRAYNRTAFLDGRRRMMQTWSDYIDTLLATKDVATLRRSTQVSDVA